MLGEAMLAALLTGTPPAAGCTPRLDLTVIAGHLPPAIRSTYDFDEIRALATRARRSLRHEALGFYASTFGYQVEVDLRTAPGSTCDVVVAQVRLILGSRFIEIAKDLEARGCRRDIVVSHYMLHAQHDDRALSAYANRALEALKAQPEAHLLGDPGQRDPRDAVTASIQKIMDNVLESYDEERRNALAAADNDEELKRLSGACIRAL
ncbi:MAG: hypothetical protein AB7Q01_13530 [Gammaproteobacteria bacterium]